MTYIAILARNAEQFKHFLYNQKIDADGGYIGFKDDVTYVYTHHLHSILGYHFDSMEIIGTFWERKDARDIEENVKRRIIKK